MLRNVLNLKNLQKALAVIAVLETMYLLITWIQTFQWEDNLPKFCSTFDNNTCLLDYDETRSSFLKRYEAYCLDRFLVGRNKDDCTKTFLNSNAFSRESSDWLKGNRRLKISRRLRSENEFVEKNVEINVDSTVGGDSNFKRRTSSGKPLPLCDCVPDSVKVPHSTFLDRVQVYINNDNYETGRLDNNNNISGGGSSNSADIIGASSDNDAYSVYDVCLDGARQPKNCNARHKTVIIIPFRGREMHLKVIIDVLHNFLQSQNLAYNIYVVEQKEPAIFNKAALMNAGFLEIQKNLTDVDCYIFHDVDMVPLEIGNFYVCVDMPRHIGVFLKMFNYKLFYNGIFGGATGFRREQFVKFNGFSNKFFGWGGEDDDILKRVRSANMMVNRFPSSIARYKMLSHHADSGNPANKNKTSGFDYAPSRYLHDGLNSAQYTVNSVVVTQKYTHILISLPSPPPDYSSYSRSGWTLTEVLYFPIFSPYAWGLYILVAFIYMVHTRRRAGTAGLKGV